MLLLPHSRATLTTVARSAPQLTPFAVADRSADFRAVGTRTHSNEKLTN